ncbi:MAG: formate dehydrogenase accessory sulfurtransferase FdhD [Thalassotalea sp.]
MEFHSTQINKQVNTLNTHLIESDMVICEQPLQVNLVFLSPENNQLLESFVYTITMRTPGNEQALIAGLLLSDGIVNTTSQIISMTTDEDNTSKKNLWEVELTQDCRSQLTSINKYQATYSSCGLCGNTSLNALELKAVKPLSNEKYWLHKQAIFNSEIALLTAQRLQSITGGAHCAALFNLSGEIISLKEDIGRHNALDKLIGNLALNNVLIASSCNYLVISSRVSFEMVQKAIMAGIGVIIALGAPSALAIQAAQRFDLTLIAFLKKETFNVYHGDWRLKR